MKPIYRTSPITAVAAVGAGRSNGAAQAPTLQPLALIDAIDAELRSVFETYATGTPDFWGMSAYHLGWADYEESPALPGKRLRPLLTLLSASAAGGGWRTALPLAAAVELLHGFSLVHDDIQDAGEVRRGRPSVWAKWGVGPAINAGDSLFALAHLAVQHATALSADQRLEALDLLGQACVRLGEGQHLDMAFEGRTGLSLADYMEMIEGKTAALIGLAMELGGLAAGASGQARTALRRSGVHLGVAFQIRDDILGIWGKSAVTGKPSSDIAGRKKTLPIVLGLGSSPELREMLRGPGAIDVEKAVRLLETSGAREYSLRSLRQHVTAAVGHLRTVMPGGEAGKLLYKLALGLLPDDGAVPQGPGPGLPVMASLEREAQGAH